MTFLQIYNRICFKIWGSSTVPTEAVTELQGNYGIISNVHHSIQKNRNYWFMEAYSYIPVTDGTSVYSLPSDYKELNPRGFRFLPLDATVSGTTTVSSATVTIAVTGLSAGMWVFGAGIQDGTRILAVGTTTITLNRPATASATTTLYFSDDDFDVPASPLASGDAYHNYRYAQDYADYPEHYEIYGNAITLYPEPNKNGILAMRYFKYLPRPTAATWATDTDTLTQQGYDAIIGLAAAEFCKLLEDPRWQQYQQEGQAALDELKNEDEKYRRPEINTTAYCDL